MKINLIIFFLILFSLSFSCSNPEWERIEVYHFKNLSLDSDKASDTLYLIKKIKIFNSRVFETYSEPGLDSLYNYIIEPLAETENQIIFFNDTCNLISTKTFGLKEQKILIFKYYYDRKNSSDEESYIYYNPKIGLIGIYNLGWFYFDYFSYKSTEGLLEKFLSDTTGFVSEKVASANKAYTNR
jgi:hypothetical protein